MAAALDGVCYHFPGTIRGSMHDVARFRGNQGKAAGCRHFDNSCPAVSGYAVAGPDRLHQRVMDRDRYDTSPSRFGQCFHRPFATVGYGAFYHFASGNDIPYPFFRCVCNGGGGEASFK